MLTDPVTLIDQTIDNLETLSVLFEDEVDERTTRLTDLNPSRQRCRDAQRAIAMLLPKLRAARASQIPQAQQRLCLHCD
ncbi:hypothetical protein [Povalibacter sp.]|uniref:hypothetical protein n=1 Tax=Povalibacter sp. TaxID=1962978 RepID=UPI002F40479C